MLLSEIHLNPDNPRIIRDEKLTKLAQSIKDFPAMMELRPIVVNSDMMILGGNMRYRACQELGMKEVPDAWVKIADKLTEDEQRRFTIEDNVAFGDWDWDMLKEWDSEELKVWGVIEYGNSDDIEMVNTTDDWVGMPEFKAMDDTYKIIIQFKDEPTRKEFIEKYKIDVKIIGQKTYSCWYPFKEMGFQSKSLKYE